MEPYDWLNEDSERGLGTAVAKYALYTHTQATILILWSLTILLLLRIKITPQNAQSSTMHFYATMGTSTQRVGVTHFPHMKQQEHMQHYALYHSSTYGPSLFEKNAYNVRQNQLFLLKQQHVP
jgi:hypothetical protein